MEAQGAEYISTHSNIGGVGVVERCIEELKGRVYLDLFQLVRCRVA